MFTIDSDGVAFRVRECMLWLIEFYFWLTTLLRIKIYNSSCQLSHGQVHNTHMYARTCMHVHAFANAHTNTFTILVIMLQIKSINDLKISYWFISLIMYYSTTSSHWTTVLALLYVLYHVHLSIYRLLSIINTC